jgi:hypothetical protein
MAKTPDRIEAGLDDHEFGAGSLIRMASWGIGAAAALFLAVLAGLSDHARPRVAQAVAALTGKAERAVAKPVQSPAPAPAVVAVPQRQSPPQPNLEVRRLHEQVRLLAADRDRLVHRVGLIERSLEDVTGSIRRQEAAAAQRKQLEVSQPAPTPTAAAAPPAQAAHVLTAPWAPLPMAQPAASPWADPPPTEPAAETTAAIPPALPVPPPRPEPEASEPAPEPEAAAKPGPQRPTARTEQTPAARPAYGIDLGGATSVDRLRLLWQTLRTNEAKLLQGLRPITHVRELRRGGRPDMRLIAGPLASADDAAKLCAEILNAGRYCEPAVFHGQRLSLR